MKQKWYYS